MNIPSVPARLTPADIDGAAGLARIIYNLPMHPMTREELAQCEFYKSRDPNPEIAPSDSDDDEVDADLYCIALAAVVYCRLFGQKIRHTTPGRYMSPAQKFRKLVPKHLVPQHHINLIIAHIHNHFHEGPKTILAPAEFF